MDFQNSSAYLYLQINAEKMQYWTLNLVEKYRSYCKKQKSSKIKETDCTFTVPVSRHSFIIGFGASVIWHGDTLINCSITEPGPVFTGIFLSAHYAAFSPVFNIICGLLVLPVYSWYIFAGTFW